MKYARLREMSVGSKNKVINYCKNAYVLTVLYVAVLTTQNMLHYFILLDKSECSEKMHV